MNRYVRPFAELLAPALGCDIETAQDGIAPPPKPGMGELGFACFALAKERRQAPPAIAAEVAAAAAESLSPGGPIAAIKAVGPYVNAFLDAPQVADEVVRTVFAEGEAFGRLDIGRGGAVPVDFSSPNIAKPFGIHHLRSTVIGHALVGLLEASGYRPIGINHIGDWGTQFGQLLAIWQDQGDEARLADEGIDYLLSLYVEFNRRKAEQPELQDRARACFKSLEDGEAESRRLWKLFRDVSLAEFERVYGLLGIRFDDVRGESFYEDLMAPVLAELQAGGLLTESEEATVVDLEEWDLGVALVRKRDGSTLYITRDLAAADYRRTTYDFTRSLYVVGGAQSLHFKQMKQILSLLGRDWADQIEHVPFGLMRFSDRKMSTRSGDIILLEAVLEQAVALARETILSGASDKGRPPPDGLDDLARQIGVGAVVFNDLKHRRARDVVFDWDEVLSFEGSTGPYLQYTAARIASMSDKFRDRFGWVPGEQPAGQGDDATDLARLDRPEELALCLALDGLPASLERAVRLCEPSLVADRLLDIAARFSTLYAQRDWKVISDDAATSGARMMLALATRRALVNGLGWLGIEVPARM